MKKIDNTTTSIRLDVQEVLMNFTGKFYSYYCLQKSICICFHDILEEVWHQAKRRKSNWKRNG